MYHHSFACYIPHPYHFQFLRHVKFWLKGIKYLAQCVPHPSVTSTLSGQPPHYLYPKSHTVLVHYHHA